jgi:hypothetical protein
MSDDIKSSDRRNNRSDNRTMAVHYLLMKLADDFGLKAFAVATGDQDKCDEEHVVQNFRVDGEEMFLTAIGEAGTMRELGIYRAIMGIRRIWREIEAVPT